MLRETQRKRGKRVSHAGNDSLQLMTRRGICEMQNVAPDGKGIGWS